ncbi:hypothetical protein OWV82_004630 [Melia azedarach]|uniref:Uncharacterized protein n=1 Tax=Melia azedarach TaxID=155640 RepID=A0ACC1YPT2_MELAZ|nr:hypothetical protein OWV82_004630 [Melia azedarach]
MEPRVREDQPLFSSPGYKLQSRTHPKASVSDLYSESSLLLCISSLNHLRKCLAVAETVAVAPAASAAAAVEDVACTLTWVSPRRPPPRLSSLGLLLSRCNMRFPR